MRLQYSTSDPIHDEFDSLPRLTLQLYHHNHQVEAVGLVDSGATVNVLPYELGLNLGGIWDDRQANIRLAGNLGKQQAIPFVTTAVIGDFPPTKLAFAWVKTANIPLILGQTNFFMEFDICFYRSRLEFEIKPVFNRESHISKSEI
ncbi:MAG: hypothetical protein GY796_00215 [Chloroflexi bacterium]|nr:hypothetical protein [Chloroflexota bacterium]